MELKTELGTCGIWDGKRLIMGNRFTESEEQLAHQAIDKLGDNLSILIGGLGMGYTLKTALSYKSVQKVDVIENSEQIIEWNKTTLSNTECLNDPRVNLIVDDFFSVNWNGPYNAILIDIDDYPDFPENHAWAYSNEGLLRIREYLKDDAIFGLWCCRQPLDTSEFTNVFKNVDVVTIKIKYGTHYLLYGES